MKRVQEKIKDLIEVRTFEAVKNYAADAEQTVAAYRFTDATSDLLAKWLDRIAALAHDAGALGAAHALAGNRGAGKSHLLAVLSALLEQPELRSRVTDAHVLTGSQSLPRRRLRTIKIERGSAASLVEEFRNALEKTFGVSEGEFSGENTAAEMLSIAARRADAAPLFVIVDSAQTRNARVKRDDGAALAEMAEIAKNSNAFLVVALDDDISGADGVNAAITRSFQIDFLDQEHLYRVLDSHIFPKKPAARTVLRELYGMMRQAMPGFRWSEPHFTTLYPIHPAVAEAISAIRLYAQNFAFLPVASESVRMTLNRPAHSLIALDEIFDRAESELRKSPDLTEVFAVYDDLATNAVGRIPVMQRLQAKLALKGLFVLSLDGRGASSREIAAAMLIYDENAPDAAVFRVEEILRSFAAATDKLLVQTESGETAYCFRIGANLNFENRLTELSASTSPAEINEILRQTGAARFPDWNFGDGAETKISAVWRGSLRRGRVSWQTSEPSARKELDWEIAIAFDTIFQNETSDVPHVVWQPAALRPDEEQVLRRFAVLQTNAAFAEEFGESATIAVQSYTTTVKRIWTRIFVEDAAFFLDGEKLSLASETAGAETLADFLAAPLAPVFDRKFPAHPHFAATLTNAEVSTLVGEFFGNSSAANSPAVRQLAEGFLLPLGLAVERGSSLALESDEKLFHLPLVRRLIEAIERNGEQPVSIEEINDLFGSEPFGLASEAQYLVLAALVASRRLELVTKTGERVGHRVLDLKINWWGVAGVVRPLVMPLSSSELIEWGRKLTGAGIAAQTLDAPEDEFNLREALGVWLARWNEERVLKRFEQLDDDVLNVHAWRLATRAAKTFGVVAEAVETALDGKISIGEALERIAEAFAKDFGQIGEAEKEMLQLRTFVQSIDERERIWRYVALAETTADERTENAREQILMILERHSTAFEPEAGEQLSETWKKFDESFASVYIERHDALMQSAERRQTLEKIFQSGEWTEFVELGELGIFHKRFRAELEKLRAQSEKSKCNFDARTSLAERPYCACGFRLIQADALERLPQDLQQVLNDGRRAYRQTLAQFAAPLSFALRNAAHNANDAETAHSAAKLIGYFERGENLPMLQPIDVKTLKQAFAEIKPLSLETGAPRFGAPVSREELRTKLNSWLDNLPDEPFLVKLADGEK